MRNLLIAIAAAALSVTMLSPCAFGAGPYIYVANAGDDTVSKIDVTGNGTEVARYPMWFTSGMLPSYFVHDSTHFSGDHGLASHAGAAPSRIAQNSLGDIYVLDRFFSKLSYYYGATSPNPPHLPVLLKLTPSPSGATSTGSTVLPMLDSIPNYNIDPTEIQDTAIVWAKPVGIPGTNLGTGSPTYNDEITLGRALAIDKNDAVWVGMYGDTTASLYPIPPTLKPNTAHYYKYDKDGNFLAGPIDTKTHTPYGAQVDINGHLWSVDYGTTLAEIDTNSNTLVGIYTHSGKNYSLAVSNDCSSSPPKVKVYMSDKTGNSFITFDAQTHTVVNYPPLLVPHFASASVAVDSHGNVFSGAINGEVLKVSPSGTKIWDTTDTGKGPTQWMTNLHGLIVDKNDDVWAVDLQGNRVVKYSGASGQFLNPPNGLKVGDSPYTYNNAPPPTCTGASPTPSPTPSPSVSPTATPTPTPTVVPGCAVVTGQVHCQSDGSYSYTFTVTNSSAGPISQILLTPAQGSTFTLSPQLTNLSTPLQNGQSTSVTTNIGNVKPGDKVCFFVSLMSEKAQCCIVEVCLTLPNCGDVTPTPTVTTSLPPPPLRQQPGRRRRP